MSSQDALEAFERNVADSTTFRNLIGADSQAKALSRIYQTEVTNPNTGLEYTAEELRGLRPYVLIDHGIRSGQLTTGPPEYDEHGEIYMELCADVPDRFITPAQVSKWFLQLSDAIVDDILGKCATAGYMVIERFELDVWERVHPKKIKAQGDWIMRPGLFTWGRGSIE